LDGLLAELAPEYDYVVVEGYHDAALPTVALGDREHDGDDVLQTAPDADSVDVDALLDALDAREPFETLASLVERVKASPDAEYSGAIATFTGRVRAREGPDDPATEFLEFERYDGVAQQKMAAIERELEEREGVYEVLLHHRTGVIDAGEDIVFVVVLAGHRTEAFRTVEDGINRLKAEVPLFKKEVTVDGEFWAHQHDTGEEPEDGVADDTPSPAEPSPEQD
jgi:molybdopterin synthase catalytic subunit